MTTLLYYAVVIVGAAQLACWFVDLVEWIGGGGHHGRADL